MSQQTKQVTEWPSEEGIRGIEERYKESPERREHSKARAWPCIRLTMQRKKQDDANYDQAYGKQPAPPEISCRDCRGALHISIFRTLLKTNPATSDRTKNSQIQFHSNPMNLMLREG